MSSVECLRETINEQLTAAAEEIFRVFQKTIVEYEEEISRQRRLLDVFRKPEVKLHRIELPQQHVCKEEEVLTDQQVCNQEMNSEEQEPAQIKEEQEELCNSLEGEQLVLKQETETFTLTPTCEESANSEDQTLDLSYDETQSAAEKEHVVSMTVRSSAVPESNSDDQIKSDVSESQNHKGCKQGDSGSTRNAKPKSKRLNKSKNSSNNKDNSTTLRILSKAYSRKKALACDTCGKSFKSKYDLHTHLRVHTGEKPYSCNTCEKRFSYLAALNRHMRVHTGEKPYSCNTCGKRFSTMPHIKRHMKTHTGEKPYSCNTCEKRFSYRAALNQHMRVHTGEKPYSCNICEKRFSNMPNMIRHMKTHTGEKPYSCNTCEKRFSQPGTLNQHMRVHTGTMASMQCMRETIIEQLTAAAEEIFRVFQKTIVEYETEIAHQRRLLDVFRKPEVTLHRIELPQQHVCKEEEVLTDQQVCNQEMNSEEQEPAQIKEEQEELCNSLEGEQLVLKQETETFTLTPTCEESANSEDQTLDLSYDETQSAAEKEHVVSMTVRSSAVPESNSDDQIKSDVSESQNHKGCKQGDSGSTRNAKPKSKRLNKSKNPTNNKDNSTTLRILSKAYSRKKALACDTCGKSFKSKYNLHTHLRIHTGEKPYPCNTCEKRFSEPGTLNRHMRVHTGEKPYSCNICGKRFSTMPNMKRHMKTHTGEKPYSCNTCEKRFSQPGTLNQHMRVHTGTMASMQCMRETIIEQLTAAAEEIFRVFQKTIVEYETEIAQQRRLLDVFRKPEVTLHRIELPQQHVCKEEEVLTDQQVCNQEMNSEEQEPAQIKEEQEELCNSLEGEQLVLKQETETFTLTPTCEESANSEDQTLDLSYDETQSAAEKEHVVSMTVRSSAVPESNSDDQIKSDVSESQNHKGCKQPDSGSTRNAKPKSKRLNKSKNPTNNKDNSTTLRILSKAYSRKKALACDTCGKSFKSKFNLHTHLRIHTGEKPYPCNTCEKRFSQPGALNQHMRIHTGEKPYSCKTCGKTFSTMPNMKRHMKTHTGEKPYSCNTCEKRFSQPGTLNQHMRVHTGEKPYSCSICGKSFSNMPNMKTHMKTHTGEKPYSCNTCQKGFIQLVTLTKHMRIHTGEKPYGCETCGKKFSWKRQLKVHMRTHAAGKDSVRCKRVGKAHQNPSR
ncbi:hypothetical protein PAMA_018065 [Pampus argenteus]